MAVEIKNAISPDYEPAVETVVETPVVETTPQVTETPVVTPSTEVKTETAPTTEVKQDAPVVVPFESKWKEIFGDATPEVVKQKYGQFDGLNSQFTELQNKPTYKTDAGKQVDEWMAKGIPLQTIAKLSTIKPEGLSEEQAIKLKEEIQNPVLKPEHIEAIFNSKYATSEDELDDNVKILKQASLLKDGSEAKVFLADYIGKQFNPPTPENKQAEVEKQTQELAQSWVKYDSSISQALKEISLQGKYNRFGEKGEQEQVLNYKYAPAENDLKVVTETALTAAIKAGMQPTEENIKTIANYANEVVWAKHGKQIMQGAISQLAGEYNAYFKSIINNPQLAGTTTITPEGAADYGSRVLAAEKSRMTFQPNS